MTDSDDAAMGIAHFKVVKENAGRFYWELINQHGSPMGRSMATFDTEDEAVESAEHARRLIGQAPIMR